MKVSMYLPVDKAEAGADLQSLEALQIMVAALERHGYDACFVTDHPFPGEKWLSKGGHHTLDPFVALTAVATCSRALLLHTNILVLPYRNPFLAAKAVASLDVLSAGRLIVGVGSGYMQDEFAALGADLANRGRIMEEAIAAMRAAWSGEAVTFEGEFFRAPGNRALPVPRRRQGPPLWIGGNSLAAMRRAATLADGWSPFPAQEKFSSYVGTAAIGDVAELRRRIERVHELRAELGRTGDFDICMAPFDAHLHTPQRAAPQQLIDQLAEMKEAGVTWLALSLPCASRSEYLNNIAWFKDEVMAVLNV